jgi:HK97 gp10 family phage protein
MPEIEVVWTGWDDLLEAYEKAEGGTVEQVDKTMESIGEESLSVMKGYTPVGTRATPTHKPGTLRAGNEIVPIEHGFILQNLVEYAPFVNWGTTKMSAQPFLEPTVEYAMKAMDQQLPDALAIDE